MENAITNDFVLTLRQIWLQVIQLDMTSNEMEANSKIIIFSRHEHFKVRCPRNKQKKIRFEQRNKICFGCVSVCFVKPKTKKFGLSRCFEPISKQLKETELLRNKPKQTETTLNVLKNTQICSPSNGLGRSSVCFGSIETLKLSVSV
jgi:hypothetical protein